MKEYLDVLQKILDEGVEKESGRANMPNTIGISKADIGMKLSEGFPLLTTKRMFWKGIVHELLWFLRGETNIKYLVDNKVNIWNGDAYRWYLKKCEGISDPWSMDDFIEIIKSKSPTPIQDHRIADKNYKLGDLGKVYGHQWRNQNGVDQVQDVMDGLKSNPYSRYHIIDGYNKADFPEMALPPCHLLYQFIVRPLSEDERREILREYVGDEFADLETNILRVWEYVDKYFKIPKFYLDLNMYQRSCDFGLGVPFNIASMSLLLMIIAKANNMIAGTANWIGGDTHVYINHIDTLREQLKREPFNLPQILINKEFNTLEEILTLTIDDFQLIDYKSHPSMKMKLSVGLPIK